MRKSFLVSILMLNEKQEQLLNLYRSLHQSTVTPLRKELKASMMTLNSLRNQSPFANNLLREKVNRDIEDIINKIQVANTKYLKSVKLMCSEDQLKCLDEISN